MVFEVVISSRSMMSNRGMFDSTCNVILSESVKDNMVSGKMCQMRVEHSGIFFG